MSITETADLWTIKETSAYLKIGSATASRWINENKIPGLVRVGGSWRVRSDVLLQAIESGGF